MNQYGTWNSTCMQTIFLHRVYLVVINGIFELQMYGHYQKQFLDSRPVNRTRSSQNTSKVNAGPLINKRSTEQQWMNGMYGTAQ